MAWTKPAYARDKVNAAAKALVAYDSSPWSYELHTAREEALPIINNWRSSHSFPLNTFRMSLNRSAGKIDPECLLAQRIKRLSSISAKLRRFPDMKFTQMQDIGGCRAVLASVDHVHALVEFYKRSQIKHKFEIDDYIANPQSSGYRGIHIKFKYYSDKKLYYNDLKIEMQLRSSLQHAWATAVETVGTFMQQALKSSLGEAEWLRFFALMGAFMALQEGTSPVPETHENEWNLLSEIYEAAWNLDVENRLRAYANAIQVLKQPDLEKAQYFLLTIDPAAEQVTVQGYKRSEILQAADDYLQAEKKISREQSQDAVLVSVDSAASLERAYPNYFADTHVFLRQVQAAMVRYEELAASDQPYR